MLRSRITATLCHTLCLVIAILNHGSDVAAAEIEWQKTAEGETAFVPMKSAPYPHPSRAEGHTYNKVHYGADKHYSDSTVGLFVPRGFRRTSRVNLLIYLHGWNNNVAKAIPEYKLREQIVASGQNIILVFPEGPRDAPDSACGKLEDPHGLKHLVDETLATLCASGKLDTPTLGHVLLAGHSGAYKGIANSADHGGLDEHLSGICLLDASYGNLDMFVGWIQKKPGGRFFSIFTDHLAKENVYLYTHIHKLDNSATLSIDTDATHEDLASRRIVFLHTETLNHEQTTRWLEGWLKSLKFD